MFRIAKNDPPVDADFLTYHELRINRGDAIRRRGLSVYRDVSDAEHVSRAFRNIGKIITKATLQADHGKTKQTGTPTHTTWWPYVEVDRRALFTVVGTVS